jgi:hypothetical protein
MCIALVLRLYVYNVCMYVPQDVFMDLRLYVYIYTHSGVHEMSPSYPWQRERMMGVYIYIYVHYICIHAYTHIYMHTYFCIYACIYMEWPVISMAERTNDEGMYIYMHTYIYAYECIPVDSTVITLVPCAYVSVCLCTYVQHCVLV